MTRTQWKKKLTQSKYAEARTLALLLLVSLVAHIAVILLVPSFTIFPPSPVYIEVDMLDIGQAFSGKAEGEEAESSDIQPPRIPEDAAPAVETGLNALEWDAFAPRPAENVQEFTWQTLPKPESVPPETVPRAEIPVSQEMGGKEPPEVATRQFESESLNNDAVVNVEQLPRQPADQTPEIPDELGVSAPSEATAFVLPDSLPLISDMHQNNRTMPIERFNTGRDRWEQPEREKENILPARLPEAKSIPEFEQQETFHVDVPPVASVATADSEQQLLHEEEEMPVVENVGLPAPSITPLEPILTTRAEREALPALPIFPERERQIERIAQPTTQTSFVAEKAIPTAQPSEMPLVPTIARNIQQPAVAENADEFQPPPPVTTRPRIIEDEERNPLIRNVPTVQPARPDMKENERLPARFEPFKQERAISAIMSEPETTMTKAQPQTLDEIEEVAREVAPPEDVVQIEGPASARKVAYRPARLPSVTLDRDVTIRLKFWVLPDGTIGEVIPLQRGDIRLEQAAIQYVKSWRFTPISGSEAVWGIIPVKYRLK
ncbi:hypothetical protein U14_02588 [Candidatus Moduliflexus flocculans]|uniref:TonB C-terminal domain-containing protein n=1 Tax=Candidatus Moduliflexus flocculans TaxID=1499966 RepID=A0A081BLS9_9BACT|nr:hypothetical protein U14_02588 [Candidatus Moduliflexus flocculans]